ncbi:MULTISPECIES: DUF2231 domain-containing protein [unclassified Sporolactobacillus]|uniref:DUF2231 domain-containing protein n=1 Tax=unclassified Sporolactobacillus TaxID=2628533 RepID=UPI0023681F92|nr:DUF2231 domain-containing protein [Sporolactobacillus sp. CQH2019]MDD9150248.1 hypothetical protein [Sporolactobacillus sp. CQH2019]
MATPNVFNTFHFLVLHFPIALIVVSFLCDLVASFVKKSKWNATLKRAGFMTLIATSVMGIVTCLAGLVAAESLGLMAQIGAHATKAIIFTIYVTLLAVIRIVFFKSTKKDFGDNLFYLIFSLIGAILAFTLFKVYRYPHWGVLQFTVPLIIIGFLADLSAVIWKAKSWAKSFQDIGYSFLILGTVAIIATVITGYMRAAEMPALAHAAVNPVKYNRAALELHETWGVISMIAFIILSAVRSYFHFHFEAKDLLKGKTVYIVGAVVCIAIISFASHLGGTVALFPELFGK